MQYVVPLLLDINHIHVCSSLKSAVVAAHIWTAREEVAGHWRTLHSEELQNLWSSQNIVKVIKSRRTTWVAHLARMEDIKNAYIILVGKPEAKVPHGRPRRKWEDNIRLDLREIG
jgi:hypothetical protein